jgi:hypothetical protein
MTGIFATAVFCVAVSLASGQNPPASQSENAKDSHADCPMHKAHHEATASAMNERGEKGMRFSQTATTHHFLLKSDGGAIQVEANDPADTTSRDNIRMHLSHIAKAFSSGDFEIPMFVHDTVPPGVPVMKQMSGKISYKFKETPAGGRVVITTADLNALAAIQEFLRFQIAEHKTGDSTPRPLVKDCATIRLGTECSAVYSFWGIPALQVDTAALSPCCFIV